MEKPAGVPVAFADYIKMMFDLQVLAFQADVTRVSTLLFGREASVRTYSEIGVRTRTTRCRITAICRT